MNAISKIQNWGDNHHPWMLDLIRITLGIFLFLKGFTFMQNTAYLKWVIENQTDITISPDVLVALAYYVMFAHMVGGALITLGVYTRLSSIMQIPIVLGAVFVNNVFKSPVNTELWLSITALTLLLIFTIIGSGPIALDRYLENCME